MNCKNVKKYILQLFESEVFCLFGLFKCKDKFSSNTYCTDHINVLLMCIDDLFYNCKSKAGSFAVFSAGGIDFVKAVPYFGKTLFGDSGSVVFYRDKNFSMVDSGFQCDR